MHERIKCVVCGHEYYAPVGRVSWCPHCRQQFWKRKPFPTLDEIRYEGRIYRIVNEAQR